MPEDSPHISLLCPACQQMRRRRVAAVVGELVGADQSSQCVARGVAARPARAVSPEDLQVGPSLGRDEDEARLLGAAGGFGFVQAVDEWAGRGGRRGVGEGGGAALLLSKAEDVGGAGGGEVGEGEPGGAEGAEDGPVAAAVVAAVWVGGGRGGEGGAVGVAACHEGGELGGGVDERVGGVNRELLGGAEVDGGEAADVVAPGEHHLDGGDDVVEGARFVAVGEIGAEGQEHLAVEILSVQRAEGVKERRELLAVVRDGDGFAAVGLEGLEPELGEVHDCERRGAGREAAALAGLLPRHPGGLQVREEGGAAGGFVDREVAVLAAPVGEPDAGGVEFEGGGAHGGAVDEAASMQCATEVGNCQKKVGSKESCKWLVGRGLGVLCKNAGRGPIRCPVWRMWLIDNALRDGLPSENVGSLLVVGRGS